MAFEVEVSFFKRKTGFQNLKTMFRLVQEGVVALTKFLDSGAGEITSCTNRQLLSFACPGGSTILMLVAGSHFPVSLLDGIKLYDGQSNLTGIGEVFTQEAGYEGSQQ